MKEETLQDNQRKVLHQADEGRVSAFNAQGETVNSDAYMPRVPDLPVQPAPAGFAYSNKLGSNSGYVMLNWDKIDGATGYKVWIFNG